MALLESGGPQKKPLGTPQHPNCYFPLAPSYGWRRNMVSTYTFRERSKGPGEAAVCVLATL